MANPETPKKMEKTRDDGEAGGRRALKGALIFGVIAATIEIGVVLWLMYR